MITKLRDGLVLLVLLAVAGVGYVVVEGSPSQRVHKERRAPEQAAPVDDDESVHVKLSVIVDGSSRNSSPERFTIQYTVNGVKYPPGPGAHHPTDRYWWRLLKVRRGTHLSLGVTNPVRGQRLDACIYYANSDGAAGRVIDCSTVLGVGGALAQGVAR